MAEQTSLFANEVVNNSEGISKILDSDWLERLKPFIDSQEFSLILNKIKLDKSKGITVYPKTADVFKALNLCSFRDLKVIMAAQD